MSYGKITKHIMRVQRRLIVPWNTQESCNIQQNTTTTQITQSFGNSISFCINSLEIYSIRNSWREINNNPCKIMRGGYIFNWSYKISGALSHNRNEYIHPLFKIVDKKVITSLNTYKCSLCMSEDILTFGGHWVGLNVLL